MKRCLEARAIKSTQCQTILLEILPRLASFVDIHNGRPFQQIQEISDHLISINSKYPQALLSLGLLSLNRTQAMRGRVPQIFQIIVQHMQTAVNKSVTATFMRGGGQARFF